MLAANCAAVATPGVEEQQEFGLVRGLFFGVAFSLPLWGAIIAIVRLIA